MAACLHFYDKHVVVINGGNIAAYEIGSDKKRNVSLPVSTGSKPGDGKDDGSDKILAAGFSSSGKYFAACNDFKHLTILDVGSSWTILNTRQLPRRATALTFNESDTYVLVADKSGDVRQFKVVPSESDCIESGSISLNEDDSDAASIVMGHVSMLLDLKLTVSERFLVTCDRDEKIRVSHYPNSYNIQSFCLGHKDFVSRLAFIASEDLLVSGSGDGTIKLWEYKSGQLLDDVDCANLLQHASTKTEPCGKRNLSSLASTDSPTSSLTSCWSCSNNSAVGRDGSAGEIRCCGADVKCLVYSGATSKIIAVSFERRPEVLFFKLTCDEVHSTYRLTFQYRLQTDTAVWDIAFVHTNIFVILQSPSDGATAVIPYMITENQDVTSSSFSMSPLTSENCTTGLLVTTDAINQDTEFFKDGTTLKNITSTLHKVHIDNLKEYIARKRARVLTTVAGPASAQQQQQPQNIVKTVTDNNSEISNSNNKNDTDMNGIAGEKKLKLDSEASFCVQTTSSS